MSEELKTCDVDEFIRLRGVTVCPAAYAVACSGEIPAADKAAHLARGPDPAGDAWRLKNKAWLEARARGVARRRR